MGILHHAGMKLYQALFLLFVGLKLTGYIAWSWVWVFAPLWIYGLIALVAGFITGYRAVRRAELRQAEKPHSTPCSPVTQRKH